MTPKRFLKWVLFSILLLLAAGCGSSAAPTPTPISNPLTVDITPSASPVIPALNQCAAEIDGLEIQLNERYSEFSEGDLLIRLGEPAQFTGFAAQIALEELVVVLHPSNPVGSLTPDEIRGLFSGQVSGWDTLGGADVLVNVWVPLGGDEARTAFDSRIMDGLPDVSSAKLAPDPAAMQQAVSADPYAVGYLAQANRLEAYDLRAILPGVRLPVLILADRQPEGLTADLVACLQTGSGQEALAEVYP
ncbi:MAG TPA: substrate-binding domain-containing protein [Anaerolineales bacterium]|nr:substrate-binding domain-containing protein [Anaerolineales bacterium]